MTAGEVQKGRKNLITPLQNLHSKGPVVIIWSITVLMTTSLNSGMVNQTCGSKKE